MPTVLSRQDRDAVAAAVERFLSGEIGAFKFDDLIFDIARKTKDATVSNVVHFLWYFYDDLVDHKVALNKDAWDYFQRLLLVLRSDAHITLVHTRRWRAEQKVAIGTLVTCGVAALVVGLRVELLALLIPCIVIALVLTTRQSRSERKESEQRKMRIALWPFGSISEVLAVRRSVPNFKKAKYPPGINRPIHPLYFELRLPRWALCMFFAPVMLVFQAFPFRETSSHVVLARV